jgi:hypothetical protein
MSRQLPLTRASLEPAFFAQCYANAPFALAVSLAATLWQYPDPTAQTGASALAALSAVAFLAVEVAWFRKALGTSLPAATWNALVSYAGAFAVMLALGWLVGGAW